MNARLQHVRLATSNQQAEKKGNRMGGLDANWLSADLALVDADVAAWSPGLRESFEALYGESDKADVSDEDTSSAERL